MTPALLIALGAALALGAVFAAARMSLPSVRTAGGVALMLAALGLAAARQFALAVPVGLIAAGLLRAALAAARAAPRSGGRSEVRTSALAMRLDHDSGEMDGEVLTGRFAGARLSQLTLEALDELASELAADPDSLGLVLAYLERRRGPRTEAPPPAAAEPGAMSEAEARRILGLTPGASVAEVRAAHRRLMLKLHPDLGGSDALAAMINAAKARLDP